MNTLYTFFMRACVLLAVLLVVLFGISVWESQPMYAGDNSPPYGPPIGGGLLLGGLMVVWLILPSWLKGALLFGATCLVALVAILLDALGRLVPRRAFRS